MPDARHAVLALVSLAGVVAPVAAQHNAPLQLEQGEPTRVEPLRLAPAVLIDGEVHRVGEWLDPPAGGARLERDRIFDCFGDSNGDRQLDGGHRCRMGNDHARWYFGTGFCNVFSTNDMTLAAGTDTASGADGADMYFLWTADGSFTTEQCVIGIFTRDTDANECEPAGAAGGFIFDLGDLPGYEQFYGNFDLPQGQSWQLPADGQGSYVIAFLTDDGNEWATCAQPYLWGTGDNACVPSHHPGTQGPNQLDDTNPRDGMHTVPDECFSYDYSDDNLQPEILGSIMQFWGYRESIGTEWPRSDGGNGHWYDIVLDEPAPNWHEARRRARAAGGHLVTVESAGEAAFLYSLIELDNALGPDPISLGGLQGAGSGEPDEGWRWVTGTPMGPAFWDCERCAVGACEPNDSPGDADFLYFRSCSGAPGQFLMMDGPAAWGEFPYLIEWDADCNGDGLVDYGQILRGELDDFNDDGVPDICGCPADFNFDGTANSLDVLDFLNAWAAGDPRADTDGNGEINTFDVLTFLNLWNAGCP